MAAAPSANTTSVEEQTEQSRRYDFPVLHSTYIAGRMIMVSILIYFLIRAVFDEMKYPYHWLGFVTIHVILECSVTYSDPLWSSKCIKIAKIHIHSIFAVTALISGTFYFLFRKITVSDTANLNSTGNATGSSNMAPHGPWHCTYSYWLLSLILSMTFFMIFLTGVILYFNSRLLLIHLYQFHKCGGTLVTYGMILLLACNIFGYLFAPINWIIFLLAIVAFVLMPIRIFAGRSINNQ